MVLQSKISARIAAVDDHGGSLEAARRLFPDWSGPWLDLSTGINPYAYPQLDLTLSALTRLPEPAQLDDLRQVSAAVYGAPALHNVVAAPGTQILLPLVGRLAKPTASARKRAVVLGPTYAEHIRAAALVGYDCVETSDFTALFDADLAILVNPNNPDGRLIDRERLLDLSAHLAKNSRQLIVDEAFMDVSDLAQSIAGDVEACGAVVLRSFGKFFGLAGVRLGFAIAPRRFAEKLSDELGPWAVSGPALEIGLRALGDREWQSEMRSRLEREAAEVDQLFAQAGIPVQGGTSLFRYLRTTESDQLFETLGRVGIWVRRFRHTPDAIRLGIPASGSDFERLASALDAWRGEDAA